MKVGTDGVLLGAWATVSDAKRILDIGTGTCLIALMMAQRNAGAKIDAIEIDDKSYDEAKLNSSLSPWSDRIAVIKGRIQEFQTKPHKYDLIISNPPFFKAGTASPIENRHQARHSIGLAPIELIDAVDKLLNKTGRFCVILPLQEGCAFMDLAIEKGLFLSRKTAFFAKQNKRQERWLLEFQKENVIPAPHKETLVQYDEIGKWSDAYKELTTDFYLRL